MLNFNYKKIIYIASVILNISYVHPNCDYEIGDSNNDNYLNGNNCINNNQFDNIVNNNPLLRRDDGRGHANNDAMPNQSDLQPINDIYELGNYYSSGNQIEISKKEDWTIPDGVIEKNICDGTCCLNTDWCESYKEYFIETNVPVEKCEEYSNPIFRFKQ